MLDTLDMSLVLPRLISKVAFRSGRSKQGKASRA